MLLPNEQIINEAINTLPKYRVTEINKKATEQIEQKVQTPKTAKSNSPNKKESQKTQGLKKEELQNDDFTYQGRKISGQYQIHLAEIILSLKKMRLGNFPQTSSLQEKWDEEIEKLGDVGIQESKPIIVSCIYWLLNTYKDKSFNNQDVLNAILMLLKKIYCIERSVQYDELGHSQELKEAISITLMSSQWLTNTKQIDALMNVVISAAGSTLNFIEILKQILLSYRSSLACIGILKILEFSFNWIKNKIEFLQMKGIKPQDFEDLRSIGLQYLQDITDEQQRDNLISLMVNFKNALQERKNQDDNLDESSIQHHNDDDQDEEEKVEVKDILKSLPQSPQKDDDLKYSQLVSIKKCKGQEIAEMLDQNFEQGLMMIKELASSEEAQDPTNKELVFSKLLKLVENHCKNPQQQYQQAYALKALMWVKAEILGLEDCFKFTTQVMASYAKTTQDQRDNSVELYLLNHWVKDLSLRDMIDRVSQACNTIETKYFEILFVWLLAHNLNAANTEWVIEDLRKVSVLIAQNLRIQEIQSFIQHCVEKFGSQKVKEFMEIQLMHHQQEYNLFIQWFTYTFKLQEKTTKENKNQKRLILPSINVDEIESEQEIKRSNVLDIELQNALKSQHIDESACSSARSKHSQLYQKLRERRKNSNQRKNEDQEPRHKYEDIINRLETQIQQPIKVQQEQASNKKNKTNSSNFYSNISNRYETVKTEEDFDDTKPGEFNDDQIQKTQNALMTSQVKEIIWKDELSKLEEERNRIEKERDMLMNEKYKETDEWKNKYEFMREEHEGVIENLKEANKCYLTQVNENEDLRTQLKVMQEQHIMMMKKFEEIENKINKKEEAKITVNRSISLSQSLQGQQVCKISNIKVITEEKIAKIEQAFIDETTGQIARFQNEGEIGLKKIQELLLNADKDVAEEIGQPLLFYYSKIKSYNDKLVMIQGLNKSLDNEDVLYALSIETYKALLHFLLKVFSIEKAKLESQSLRISAQSNHGQQDQNEITIEVQKIVSKLLNSKEFTTSLVTLFQILKVSMPEDITIELNEEQKQILRVIMRCISRITKALHSEHPDLIRAFDVLIEMHKIFVKNPPENLREDLPSLQDFDYVYRGLKDVTDKLMELQSEKVSSFLKFVIDQSSNAFTKYMIQMMQVKGFYINESEQDLENNLDDEYDYSQSNGY